MKRSYRSLIAVVAAILSFGLFLTACSDDVASTGANGDEAEQDHDDRDDHKQQDDVSDPPERHCFLACSATIAALSATPGNRPRIFEN